LDLTTLDYSYIALAALLVGFTKTSVGGVGILAVLLMALAIPGKASPGVLLPMLIVADIFAVVYYRRNCQWGILLKLFPLAAIGVLIGYFAVNIIPVGVFQLAIGGIILVMLVLELGLPKHKQALVAGWGVTGIIGIFAGVATMVANAAGPIFGIYLLQMGLSKKEFVGTRSWFFLIVNLFKVPFSVNLGLITTDSLQLNLMFVPVIFIGAVLGKIVLGYLNLTAFKWLIRAAVIVAAFRLILF